MSLSQPGNRNEKITYILQKRMIIVCFLSEVAIPAIRSQGVFLYRYKAYVSTPVLVPCTF